MTVSVFDLFKHGVGPSSSHTMGPMTAAARFVALLSAGGLLAKTSRVQVTLYGSLALTGRGHHTDRAVLLGLMGFEPASLDPDAGDAALASLAADSALLLGGLQRIAFDTTQDIVWAGRQRLPQHPNALTFTAMDETGETLFAKTWFSIGGGFIRDETEIERNDRDEVDVDIPYRFDSAQEMLDRASGLGCGIAELMYRNELARRPAAEVDAGLDGIHAAMEACIERGMRQEGELPGGLKVKRRAARVRASILARMEKNVADPLVAMDWINLWAMAVNEENAAGGRVVTAPTNGAAGIVPAVLRYYCRFHQGGARARASSC